MQTFLTVLFIGSALVVFLATTNFFENVTKETQTEPAEVLSACDSITQNSCGCNGAPLETKDYYITFYLPLSGKNLKCSVSKKKLQHFRAGATGMLTHKGSWLKDFTEESQQIQFNEDQNENPSS